MSDLPFRPLPALDDENTAFWTSGENGSLCITRCQACGYYLQPPSPICPECWSRDVVPEAVSGRGVIHTFTVNHQPWDGTPDPYVIAIVELEEQQGLRLTTNIVGVDPAAVRIGQTVTVTFEDHDPVWVPVFEVDA